MEKQDAPHPAADLSVITLAERIGAAAINTKEINMARILLIRISVIASVLTLGNTASAEILKRDAMPCKQFVRDTDGSWSPRAQIKMIEGGVPFTIGPGLRVRPGALIIGLQGGLDLGAALEAECGAGAPT